MKWKRRADVSLRQIDGSPGRQSGLGRRGARPRSSMKPDAADLSSAKAPQPMPAEASRKCGRSTASVSLLGATEPSGFATSTAELLDDAALQMATRRRYDAAPRRFGVTCYHATGFATYARIRAFQSQATIFRRRRAGLDAVAAGAGGRTARSRNRATPRRWQRCYRLEL